MQYNSNSLDLNLPLGYRWATADEAEAWSEGQLGCRWVPLVLGQGSIPPDERPRELTVLDDRNMTLVRECLTAFDANLEPRVGDFIEFTDGVVRRFTHRWPEGLQTTDERFGGPSFYLGDGYCSYSGSLRPWVRLETLTRKDETRLGWVWFFHHGSMGAHRGVDVQIPLRVYACTLSSKEND